MVISQTDWGYTGRLFGGAWESVEIRQFRRKDRDALIEAAREWVAKERRENPPLFDPEPGPGTL